jgi:hypothetical protein
MDEGRVGLLEALVWDCRRDLADWLPPDSGVPDREVLRRLLARLDGPQARQAMGEMDQEQAMATDYAANYARFRLERAAPALLEALRALVDDCEKNGSGSPPPGEWPALDAARAAIAAATAPREDR